MTHRPASACSTLLHHLCSLLKSPLWLCCAVFLTFALLGTFISRREAFRQLDELFLSSAAYYRRHCLWQLNLQQELIKAVEARKYDRLTSIVAMLREKGNMSVTVQYLQSVSHTL